MGSYRLRVYCGLNTHSLINYFPSKTFSLTNQRLRQWQVLPRASMPTQTGTAPKTLAPDPVRNRGHERESAPGGRDRGGFTYQPVAGVAITQSGSVAGRWENSHPCSCSQFPSFPPVNKHLEFEGMEHADWNQRCKHGLIAQVLVWAQERSSGGSSPILDKAGPPGPGRG